MQQIVILGTGLAGTTLAREIRKRDPDVGLTLVTADGGEVYAKPMLSTALTQGKEPDQLVSSPASRLAAQLDARVLTRTRVTAIDPAAHTLRFDGGDLAYDQLVLALGARPFRPPVDGDAADRILSINGLDDYRRFRRRLEGAGHVAIVGPGLIGCEFASDLLASGRQVTLIGPDPHPIATLLPAAAGRALQAALAAAGAQWRLGTTVAETWNSGGNGGIELVLASGERMKADLVLSAVGLRPDLELASGAGLETGRGIVVDRYLETSAPGIHALGDCAEVAGLNLPFVQPIMHGARALAATLTGTPTTVAYPAMPVVIKTAQHPVVAAPPPPGAIGEWELEQGEDGVRALFRSAAGELLGFALTGAATAGRPTLARELPPLLA